MKHFFLPSGKPYFPQKDPNNEQRPSDDISEPLYPYEHDVNTMDGSEFLDDFARMKEQPMETRKNQNNYI